VKAFLDTSVLVQAFYTHYPHHEPSIDLIRRHEKHEIACGAHNLAETYSVLTGMPGKDRVSSAEALLYLADIRDRLTIITLSEQEYFNAIKASSEMGVAGGAIYDALIAHCALKAEAETLYTWNARDFKRLGPPIAARVSMP